MFKKYFLLPLLLSFALLGSAQYVFAFSNTIALSKADIQQKIEQFFPVAMGDPIFKLRFSQPHALLGENRNTLGIHITIDATSNGQAVAQGSGRLIGTPFYNKEQATFYLRDPQIQRLEIEGVSPNQDMQFQLLLDVALSTILTEIPIYTLNDKNLRERFAKKRLLAVRVEKQEMLLEFSLD